MRRFVPCCVAFTAAARVCAGPVAAPSPFNAYSDRLSRTPAAFRSRTHRSSISFVYRSNCGGGGAPVAM